MVSLSRFGVDPFPAAGPHLEPHVPGLPEDVGVGAEVQHQPVCAAWAGVSGCGLALIHAFAGVGAQVQQQPARVRCAEVRAHSFRIPGTSGARGYESEAQARYAHPRMDTGVG